MSVKFRNVKDIHIENYDGFIKIIDGLDNKRKGDLFELFTKYIFMFHPNFCNYDKKQSSIDNNEIIIIPRFKHVYLFNEIPINYQKQTKVLI